MYSGDGYVLIIMIVVAMIMMMILVFFFHHYSVFAGEGKTLVAVLPIYLNALKNEGMIVLLWHDNDDDDDNDHDVDDDFTFIHFHHVLTSI